MLNPLAPFIWPSVSVMALAMAAISSTPGGGDLGPSDGGGAPPVLFEGCERSLTDN